ncbi:MAG TPA: alpha/beta fold hydrolase [Pseudosphingobacterium sp.]|nr:alpha/beta fold hydrolase [Pseudosphingobacterium sp.]
MLVKRSLIFFKIFAVVGMFLIGSIPLAGQDAEMRSFPLSFSMTKGSQDALILYITGDGGLNSFNRSLIQAFEKKQYGVVTLDSRKYFWNQKEPVGFANDVEKIALHYMKAWKKSSLVIVGYSFGADVAAFLSSRLSNTLRTKIRSMMLLSPSSSTDFVIRLSDLLAENDNASRKYKIEPEIKKNTLPLTCIFGEEEHLFLKNKLKTMANITVYDLPGNHQYGKNYPLLLEKMNL